MAELNLGRVRGKDGVGATHSWNGTKLTITTASGTSTADLKGAQGDPGYTPVKGKDYFDGSPGYTPVKGVDYVDGKDGYTPVKGKDYFDGEPGAKGDPGVSPTVTPSKSGKVTTLTIKDASGTKTATINDGVDGAAGKDGSNGVSATHSWNGTVLTITSASGTSSVNLKGDKGDTGATGPTGPAGKTPVKGTDYWTAEDQASMVQQVIAALPDASEVSY